MLTDTVLFLTYWYPHKDNSMAGIFVKKHAQAISLQRNIVVLAINITRDQRLYSKKIAVFRDEKNVETHQIHIGSRFHKLLFLILPFHYFILKRHIKQELLKDKKIGILHANILFPSSVIGYWLSKNFGWKFVITEHWSKISKFFRVSLYARSGKAAYNKAGAITCVSRFLARIVKEHTTNPNVGVVPNIIDSGDFYYDPQAKKNKKLTFIAVAHWGREKNPFYFLDALSQLSEEKKLPDFKVSIVGEGEKIPLMKSRNYGFEIDFKSQLNAARICQELNASHIFLHGSDFETFSVIIAEALMCGLPAVVSPIGIAPEVINPTNGFIAQNTVADWKEKIMLCYNTEYNHMAISEQLKGKYDMKAVGELFEGIYKSL